MTIKRFKASQNNTITNAFKEDLVTRGTGSNMGKSDVLEIFSICKQASETSVELSRCLIQFPIDQISSSRESGTIPASGSVNFFLKMYNVEHAFSAPRDYSLIISPVSQSWEEGLGLDMNEYDDLTYDKEGSNWINAGSGSPWTTVGGDYLDDYSVIASFDEGLENINIDVTQIVEDWITGSTGEKYNNYGFGIRLSSSYEGYMSNSSGVDEGSVPHNTDGSLSSYYTKMFFGRGSEFYYHRPHLEARWNDSTKDNRGNFYVSASMAPAAANLNKLYYYNYVRGALQDVGGDPTKTIQMTLWHSSGSVAEQIICFKDANGVKVGPGTGIQGSTGPMYATRESKGVYSATVVVTSSFAHLDGEFDTYPYLIDRWLPENNGVYAMTGAPITVLMHQASESSGELKHVISIPNLYDQYKTEQTIRLRPYIRKKNWSPNIYNVAKNKPENLIIEDAAYRIVRVIDDFEVVPYGTGSIKSTSLSYDGSGNYFDLSMDLFETGYQYGIKFSIYNDFTKAYEEQPYMFKFRVVN